VGGYDGVLVVQRLPRRDHPHQNQQRRHQIARPPGGDQRAQHRGQQRDRCDHREDRASGRVWSQGEQHGRGGQLRDGDSGEGVGG
jgi:hypothetical protein